MYVLRWWGHPRTMHTRYTRCRPFSLTVSLPMLRADACIGKLMSADLRVQLYHDELYRPMIFLKQQQFFTHTRSSPDTRTLWCVLNHVAGADMEVFASGLWTTLALVAPAVHSPPRVAISPSQSRLQLRMHGILTRSSKTSFEEYYAQQKIVPDAEFEAWLQTLQKPLPLDVWRQTRAPLSQRAMDALKMLQDGGAWALSLALGTDARSSVEHLCSSLGHSYTYNSYVGLCSGRRLPLCCQRVCLN